MAGLRAGFMAGVVFVMAGGALAEAPETSLRPIPRPVQASTADAVVSVSTTSPSQIPAEAAPPASVLAEATGAIIRPRARPQAIIAAAHAARPDSETEMPAVAPVAEAVALAAPAPTESAPKGLFGFLRPNKRPDDLAVQQAAAVRIKPGKEVAVSKKGSVCGIPDIKGEKLSPISAKIKGCGIASPVRVTSVAGVRLSNPATVNCETAKALRTWVTKVVEPTYGKGTVVELKVAASYACRPRNNQRGAKVSEHGRGNAIDIAGMTFSNGKSTTVLRNYDKTLRKVHKAACGIFGTTLGPGSDGFHEDHLHFDVASYRNGPYCR